MEIYKTGTYNPFVEQFNTNQNKKDIRYNKIQSKQQNFNGAGSIMFNALDKAFGVLDKNAMIQVSFVDTVSTNIPRTVVDLKTSLAASLETCRREFSGLFVNCLMPGFVVWGLAKLLPKSQELKGTDAASSWANSNAIDRFKEIYKKTAVNKADNTREFVETSLTSLRGLEGKSWVYYDTMKDSPEFQSAVDDITEAVSKKGKEKSNLLKQAKDKLAKLTKAETILEFKTENTNAVTAWKTQSNLEETIRDIADLGSKFNSVKEKTAKTLGTTTEKLTNEQIAESIEKYSKSLKGFVDKKSIIGLLLVMGVAVSMQTINRAITRKQFNAEGAPIYKDFGKKETAPKMNENQKKEFFGKKLLAAAGMYSLAGISMMKMPTKNMFQFTGKFPTLDQCRWIAASTFASRMMAAEDENELRETTIRDIASFSGLYFLGDYAKKGAASAIEMFSQTEAGKKLIGEDVVLLNRKKEIPIPHINEGDSKAVAQAKYKIAQFCNWIKNTDLKSANEVSSIKVRNLRNLCRVADISFSLIMLGILLPNYTRSITEKKVAEAKKQEEMRKKAMLDFSAVEKKNTPPIFKNI